MEELLDASLVMSTYVEKGMLNTDSCTLSVKEYIEKTTTGKPEWVSAAALRRLNSTIVARNEMAHQPTKKTRKIYKEFLEED